MYLLNVLRIECTQGYMELRCLACDFYMQRALATQHKRGKEAAELAV